jgi:hypothetical protein
MAKILFVDTACADFPSRSASQPSWEPHCVSIAAVLEDGDNVVTGMTRLIKPLPSWTMGEAAKRYHLATNMDFEDSGDQVLNVAADLGMLLGGVETIVSHNSQFHRKMIAAIFADAGLDSPYVSRHFCTMAESASICRVKLVSQGRWKSPSLAEAYSFFTERAMQVWQDWESHAQEQIEAVRVVYHGIMKHRETHNG